MSVGPCALKMEHEDWVVLSRLQHDCERQRREGGQARGWSEGTRWRGSAKENGRGAMAYPEASSSENGRLGAVHS